MSFRFQSPYDQEARDNSNLSASRTRGDTYQPLSFAPPSQPTAATAQTGSNASQENIASDIRALRARLRALEQGQQSVSEMASKAADSAVTSGLNKVRDQNAQLFQQIGQQIQELRQSSQDVTRIVDQQKEANTTRFQTLDARISSFTATVTENSDRLASEITTLRNRLRALESSSDEMVRAAASAAREEATRMAETSVQDLRRDLSERAANNDRTVSSIRQLVDQLNSMDPASRDDLARVSVKYDELGGLLQQFRSRVSTDIGHMNEVIERSSARIDSQQQALESLSTAVTETLPALNARTQQQTESLVKEAQARFGAQVAELTATATTLRSAVQHRCSALEKDSAAALDKINTRAEQTRKELLDQFAQQKTELQGQISQLLNRVQALSDQTTESTAALERKCDQNLLDARHNVQAAVGEAQHEIDELRGRLQQTETTIAGVSQDALALVAKEVSGLRAETKQLVDGVIANANSSESEMRDRMVRVTTALEERLMAAVRTVQQDCEAYVREQAQVLRDETNQALGRLMASVEQTNGTLQQRIEAVLAELHEAQQTIQEGSAIAFNDVRELISQARAETESVRSEYLTANTKLRAAFADALMALQQEADDKLSAVSDTMGQSARDTLETRLGSERQARMTLEENQKQALDQLRTMIRDVSINSDTESKNQRQTIAQMQAEMQRLFQRVQAAESAAHDAESAARKATAAAGDARSMAQDARQSSNELRSVATTVTTPNLSASARIARSLMESSMRLAADSDSSPSPLPPPREERHVSFDDELRTTDLSATRLSAADAINSLRYLR